MRSMTGFGQGRAESSLGRVTVELRTLNSRFADVSLRLPAVLAFAEAAARRAITGAIQRGKVTLSARFDAGAEAPSGVAINRPLLEALADEVRGASAREPQVETLLLVPGVVQPAADPEFEERLTTLFDAAMKGAIEALVKDREREGAILAAAMLAQHATLAEHHGKISAARGSVVEKFREKLKQRLEELLAGQNVKLDAGRLEQEVAIFADRADLSEECVRLGAHLAELESILKKSGAAQVGRRLDFLCQEIGREINTIGSKARDLDLIQSVLAMKTELESLKEQLANLE